MGDNSGASGTGTAPQKKVQAFLPAGSTPTLSETRRCIVEESKTPPTPEKPPQAMQQINPADAASLLDEQQQKLRELEFKLQRFKENQSDGMSNGADAGLSAFLESVKAKISSLDTEVEIITQQYSKDGTPQVLPTVPTAVPTPAPGLVAQPSPVQDMNRQPATAVRSMSPTSGYTVQRASRTPQRIASPMRSVSRPRSQVGSPVHPTAVHTAEVVSLGGGARVARAGSPRPPLAQEVAATPHSYARPSGTASPHLTHALSARSLRMAPAPGVQAAQRALSPPVVPTVAPPVIIQPRESVSVEGSMHSHRGSMTPGMSLTASTSSLPAALPMQQFRDMMSRGTPIAGGGTNSHRGINTPSQVSAPATPAQPPFRDVNGVAAQDGSFSTPRSGRLPTGAKSPPGSLSAAPGLASGKYKDISMSMPQFPTSAASTSASASAAPTPGSSTSFSAAPMDSAALKSFMSKNAPVVVQRQMSSSVRAGSNPSVSRQVSSAASLSSSAISRQVSAHIPTSVTLPCPLNSRGSYSSACDSSATASPMGSASTMSPCGSVNINSGQLSSMGLRHPGAGRPGSAAGSVEIPLPSGTPFDWGGAGPPSGAWMPPVGLGAQVSGFSSLSREPQSARGACSGLSREPTTAGGPGTRLDSNGAHSPARGLVRPMVAQASAWPLDAAHLAIPPWPPQAAEQAVASLPGSREGSLEMSRDAARERRRSRRQNHSRGPHERGSDFSPVGRLAPIDDEEDGLGDHVLKFQEKMGRIGYDDRRFI